MSLSLLIFSTQIHLLAFWSATPVPQSDVPVRVHSALIWRAGSWIRLWYFLRACDRRGSGRVEVPVDIIKQLCCCKSSTIYEWLRCGKAAGGFRRYSIQGGWLKIYLGSLWSVAKNLEINDWGATSVIPTNQIFELGSIKKTAAAGQCLRDQERTRISAEKSLSSSDRKFYKNIPTVEDIFNQRAVQTSPKPGMGSVDHLLFIGKRRIFVSSGFLPFGAKQEAIAANLGVSVRTVQRHLSGIEKAQIVQAKADYARLNCFLEHGSQGDSYSGHALEMFHQGDKITCIERVGVSGNHYTYTSDKNRVFKYLDRYWVYRCNLYRLNVSLTSMKAARNRYKKLMSKKRRAGAHTSIRNPNVSTTQEDFNNSFQEERVT